MTDPTVCRPALSFGVCIINVGRCSVLGRKYFSFGNPSVFAGRRSFLSRERSSITQSHAMVACSRASARDAMYLIFMYKWLNWWDVCTAWKFAQNGCVHVLGAIRRPLCRNARVVTAKHQLISARTARCGTLDSGSGLARVDVRDVGRYCGHSSTGRFAACRARYFAVRAQVRRHGRVQTIPALSRSRTASRAPRTAASIAGK